MEPIIGSTVHKDGVTLYIHNVKDGEVYFQKFYPGDKNKNKETDASASAVERLVMCGVKMKASMTIIEALKTINNLGYKTFSANTLAEIMWPESRDVNTNGQRFNLCAGIAGRMLRKCLDVREVQNRVWEIKTHRIKHITHS